MPQSQIREPWSIKLTLFPAVESAKWSTIGATKGTRATAFIHVSKRMGAQIEDDHSLDVNAVALGRFTYYERMVVITDGQAVAASLSDGPARLHR